MTFWHTPSESYKFQPSKTNGMYPPINQTILAFSSTWGIEMSKRLDIHKKSDSPNGAHESTVTGTGLDCNVLMKIACVVQRLDRAAASRSAEESYGMRH